MCIRYLVNYVNQLNKRQLQVTARLELIHQELIRIIQLWLTRVG